MLALRDACMEDLERAVLLGIKDHESGTLSFGKLSYSDGVRSPAGYVLVVDGGLALRPLTGSDIVEYVDDRKC